MTFRFPGSLVNRALRSKLLTAQQHRASIAAALRFQQTQTWLSSSPRFYSYASERSSGRNDSYRKNSRPAPGRFEKDGQKPTNKGRGNRKTFKDGLSSKKDRDLLMAIASGKESLGGRYDVDSDIAESEALDKEAAEKWSTQTETSGTEASENDASQDQASQTETANRDAPEEPSPSMIKSLKVPNKVINEELKWLSDPRDFAERVSRILHAGDPALAAALIRTGTKQGMRCDVAWNTLFQYCMDQNHPQAAFKFYNDVSVLSFCLVLGTGELLVLGLLELHANGYTTSDEETWQKTESIDVHNHVEGFQLSLRITEYRQDCRLCLPLDLLPELRRQPEHYPHQRHAYGLPTA